MSHHTPAADIPEPDIHIDRYEGLWIRITLIVIVVFIAAITVASLAFNITVPGVAGRVDPNNLDAPGNPFATPGVRELAPGKYEAYVVAQAWFFTPNPIAVPEDSEVTFYVTSRDIQHGFNVTDTNINFMVLPGQISKLTAVFDEPGTHNIICHEYCGLGHHTMYGQIVVEPAGGAAPAEGEAPAAGEAGGTVPAPAGVGESGAVTATTGVTGTAEVTGAAEITGAAEVTGTAEVTATEGTTGTGN
jgi:cytochrome c oxidase subunit 2